MKKYSLFLFFACLFSITAKAQTFKLPLPTVVDADGNYYQNYQFFSSNGCVTTTFYSGDTIFNSNTFGTTALCKSPSNVTFNRLAILPNAATQLIASTNTQYYTTFATGYSVNKTCQKVGPVQYLWGKYQAFKISTPGVYTIGFVNDTKTVDITVQARPAISPTVSIESNAVGNAAPTGKSITFTATLANEGSYTNSYNWFVNNNAVGSNNAVYTTSALNDNDVVNCIISSKLDNCSDLIYDTSQSLTMKIGAACATSSVTNLRICASQIPFTWNGLVFTEAGTQAAHLISAAGCDSVATLVLSINPPSTSTTNISAVGNYLWNGTTYTTSGTYTFKTINAAGCDSIATLVLTITSGSSSITYNVPGTQLLNAGNSANYQLTNNGGPIPANTYAKLSTVAGNGIEGISDSTSALLAGFRSPSAIARDAAGNIYIADRRNNLIRKIGTDNKVITIAGNSSKGSAGSKDTIATSASFNNPSGIAVDAAGNIYVSDKNNHKIRKIGSDGNVSTLAGSGKSGSANGTDTTASFQFPAGLAIDDAGNIYVADQGNHCIRKINTAGVVTTIAGTGTKGAADGAATSATFNNPSGLAIDAAGNIYVADQGNNKIRVISTTGTVSTFAGSGSLGFIDGAASTARFNAPTAVAVDKQGNVFVSDYSNNKIRKITAAGTVVTLAGTPGAGAVDSIGTLASLNTPSSLVLDGNGSLFIADQGNNKVRKLSIYGFSISPAKLPAGLSFDASNGTISGTPTAITPATTYTVNAYNSFGVSSTTISLQVANCLPTSSTTNINVCPSDLPYSWNGTAYSSVGTYVKTLVNAYGCDSVATLVLALSSKVPAAVSISTTDNNICSGNKASFKAVSANAGVGALYIWKKNGKTVIAGSSDTYTDYTLNNGDVVSCTLVSSLGCLASKNANSNSIKVTVLPKVVSTVAITANKTSTCSGNSITFTANYTFGGTAPIFVFQKNGQNYVGGSSNAYSDAFLNNGDVISCILISNNACTPWSYSNSVPVVVKPAPIASVSIVANTNTAVQGTKVTFTASQLAGGENTKFIWYKNNVGYKNITSNVLTDSTLVNGDVINCIMTSSDSCTPNAKSNSITMTITPKVGVTFNPASFALVNGEAYANTATIYPNPSRGNFKLSVNLKTSATVPAQVQIINAEGKVVGVYTTTAINGAINLQMNEAKLGNGLYLVKYVAGNESGTTKLVLSK